MATQNSHFIARHLTKPWEFTHGRAVRQLWSYDFDRDTFEASSSKNLFTLETPFADQIEVMLNRLLETPLSAFQAKWVRNRRGIPAPAELRALKLAILLQSARLPERKAGTTNDDIDLAALSRKPDKWFDWLVCAADTAFEFLSLPLRAERLFFPDTGLIVLPLVGARGGIAIPVHPSGLFVAVPRSLVKQVEHFRAKGEDNLTALSVGLEPCRRVVIPGSLWGREKENKLRAAIHEGRQLGTELCRTFLEANRAVFGDSMPGWLMPQNPRK